MRSKSVVRNISFSLILQIIVIIYGFVIPKIIITKYGSDVNGLVSSITQFLGYIALLESGFGPVVKATLYKPIAQKDELTIKKILKASERFFRTIAIIFLGYLLILCFLYPFIVSKQFSHMFTLSLIFIISISTFTEYYFGMTYKLYLNSEQKNYVISIIQIITYILNIIIILLISRLNVSIQCIKIVSALIFILRPILQNCYIKKKYNINLKDVNNDYKIKQKWDGLAQHIASVIHNNTDITVLTIFGSLTDVSIYTVYLLVLKGIKAIIQSFTNGIDALFGNMLAKEEHKNLNSRFNMYEVLFFSMITIFYVCTLILIIPFVKVYTLNVNDCNYVQYIFGFLIVMSEFVWAIRQPYNELIKAAGHFKETRKGAWVEAIINIVISCILVIKFGLNGVAIGTIIATLIRTIEFINHVNKFILKRSIFKSLKKILLIIVETLIIIVISNFIPLKEANNFINFGINAIIIGILSLFVVIIINLLIYKKECNQFMQMLKKILERGK